MTKNDFLSQLNFIIKEAKRMVSESPKVDVVSELAISIVEGFFYSNLISNFRRNLTRENLNEFKITKNDVTNIEKEFKTIFKRCNQTIKGGSNEGEIDTKVYQEFTEKLNDINKNAYNLLLEIEKIMGISSCRKSILQFKKEVKSLGKELKLPELLFE
ncbi:MAG: hypothetical protein Q7S55_03375 [Nanoarchaeota archaeon]|nr:hypothetical protein [Nanoarchaeota archaeon]